MFMTFAEAYDSVDKMFKSDGWKMGGVAVAGETDKIWLFKSHKVDNNEMSPAVMVVQRDTGEMHYFSVLDRLEAQKAKIVSI